MLVWYSRHHVCAYHVYVITGGGRRVTAMLYVLHDRAKPREYTVYDFFLFVLLMLPTFYFLSSSLGLIRDIGSKNSQWIFYHILDTKMGNFSFDTVQSQRCVMSFPTALKCVGHHICFWFYIYRIGVLLITLPFDGKKIRQMYARLHIK